jgi:hydrogenase-4 component F
MKAIALSIPFLPAVAGVIALGRWRRITSWTGVTAPALVLVGGAVLGLFVAKGEVVEVFDGLVRVDALSAWMILLIGIVALIATTYGVGYMAAEVDQGHTNAKGARIYYALVQWFVAAMLVAVSTDNLGVMWVAVEATTIATAFLVGHRHTRASVEASWKYVVIASVGVTVAFLGTVLVYFASRHGSGATMRWSELVSTAGQLDPGVMRTAVGLLVVGYGTKAGLAPLHTWLPDAHSQAPAPVSALMSGVLLSVAVYAILRVKVISDLTLGPDHLRVLLLIAGVASVLLAGALLLAQTDYKRLLAYSSIEHVGLMAIGAAIGSRLAVAGLLLHMLGHGIAKAVGFCASGDILLVSGSTRIADTTALLSRRPATGGAFGLALLALLGFPPFSLFASELAILRAGFAADMGWAASLTAAGLLVVFGAVLVYGQRMLLGRPVTETSWGSDSRATMVVPLAGGLILVAAIGVWMGPLQPLMEAATSVISL